VSHKNLEVKQLAGSATFSRWQLPTGVRSFSLVGSEAFNDNESTPDYYLASNENERTAKDLFY
jgi:hypothetical protein